MTKSQKDILGEINRCKDLSAYSNRIRNVLASGENHQLSNQISEYANLHYKKQREIGLTQEEKLRKLTLKSSIIQQVA